MHESEPVTPADHAAAMVVKSGQVPAKFIGADGVVDLPALADSYRALENKMGEVTPANAPPQATMSQIEPEPIAPIPPLTPQTTMDDMLNSPVPPVTTVWDKVAVETRAGGISEGTISELKANGVPDSVIAQYTSGVKASAQARTTEAANAVGGASNLQKSMEYARANYAPEQMEALKSSLNGPLWEATLKGLALQANVSTQPTEAEPSSLSTAGPAASPQSTVVSPFASQREMTMAISDPRYRGDAEYRNLVQARIRANAGV